MKYTKAKDIIEELIEEGTENFDNLDLSEKKEVVSAIYAEGTYMERFEWLCDSDFTNNILESVEPFLLDGGRDSAESLRDEMLGVLVNSCAYKAQKQFEFILEDMQNEEHARQHYPVADYEEIYL